MNKILELWIRAKTQEDYNKLLELIKQILNENRTKQRSNSFIRDGD